MNKKILIVIVVLVLIVGVTAFLNQRGVEEKKKMQREVLLSLQEDGKELKRVDLSYIKEQGEKTFSKNLDTNDSGPVEHSYTGVPLKNILTSVDIKLSGKEQVIVKSVDGYTVALGLEEVKKDDNVYIVYKTDDSYLKPKSKGGTGPLRIVIREDQFGQRWAKFVTEVNVK